MLTSDTGINTNATDNTPMPDNTPGGDYKPSRRLEIQKSKMSILGREAAIEKSTKTFTKTFQKLWKIEDTYRREECIGV